MVQNILLYGDSFFWGVNAQTGKRHAFEDRISTVCQNELGDECIVITEGLRGRTMFGENGWFPERDGLLQFGPIFASHLPLDVVVIMLGTNDLNSKTRHTPLQITTALNEYLKKMQFWCDFMKYKIPKLLIVAPPEIDTTRLSAFKEIFEGSAEQIKILRDHLANYSEEHGYTFFDSSQIIRSYGQDGIHLDATENKKFGKELSQILRTFF